MGKAERQARAALAGRLADRRSEVEQAVLTRVYAISDPSEAADPTYAEGLRATVHAAIDYALAAIELGDTGSEALPPVLLTQARMAARNGVSLETVLRRYFAGYTLLGNFVIEEAQRDHLTRGAALQRLLSTHAGLFDRLLEAVSDDFAREAASRPRSSERRKAERIERLLAGELLDTSELGYAFDGWHLGIVVAGSGGVEAIRNLAGLLDCRPLSVSRAEDSLWAWLGSRRKTAFDQVEDLVPSVLPPEISLALGEPAAQLRGWRLTHQQARAAMPIALRSKQAFVRYADVALPASVLQDEVLWESLRQIYFDPIERERDGGHVARRTLRAYIATGCNITAAAAALGVNRNTVAKRLRTVEERIGRPLTSCVADLDVALHLEALSEGDMSRVA